MLAGQYESTFLHVTSLFVQLPARVQIIEIHDRIEHQKVAAFCLAAPDRVI